MDPPDPGAQRNLGVTTIGEDAQFDASALDQNGTPIDTVFAWQSSDDGVAVVGQDGVVVATGLGTAEVYAMAGNAVDTADVTVTLAGGPVHEWVAAASGMA